MGGLGFGIFDGNDTIISPVTIQINERTSGSRSDSQMFQGRGFIQVNRLEKTALKEIISQTD